MQFSSVVFLSQVVDEVCKELACFEFDSDASGI